MLKLCCCVFDALIKKSHFICIINATEMRDQEGKTALNVQRNTKSFFFFICQFLRRWPRCICCLLEGGCHGRGGGCLNWSCENTPCNNLSKHATILNQRDHQELLDHPTGSKDLWYAFYFFCCAFQGLSRWRFLRFPKQTEQVQNEVISVKMSLHPLLITEGWDNNLTIHCMKL